MRVNFKRVISLLFFILATQFFFNGKEVIGESSPLMINNLPRTNENFTGREDTLKTIQSLLDTGYSLVAITGFLGTGKTQTARRFAELNKHNYDIVWFIDAKKSIVDQLRTLASQINTSSLLKNESPKINVNSQPDVLVQTVRTFLESTQGKWLLIFDNVPNKGAVMDFLPQHPKSSKAHIIITSRSEVGWVNPIKLKKFQRHESVDLLKKIVQINNEAQLDQLASLLFDHPLSLMQAGCYIRKHLIMDAKEYITLFSERRGDLWKKEELLLEKDIDIKDIHDNYQMTAETALRLSLEELEKQSPLGLRLLLLSSFWHNSKIPEDLLINYAKTWGYDNILDYNDAISEIIKLSFFEKDRIGLKYGEHENTYSMHDLVPIVLQDTQFLEEKEKNIKDSLRIFAQFLKGGWDKSTRIFSRRPHLLPHIETISDYAEKLKIYENDLIELKLHLLEYHTYYTRDQETYEEMVHEIEALLKKVKNVNPFLLARFYSDRVYSRSLFREEDERYSQKIERDFHKAISIFQSSSEYIDELFRAYLNFAQYYLFLGSFEKSLLLIDKAEALLKNIKIESNKTLFYFMKAWILTQKGDDALAQKTINQAIDRLDKEENLVFRIYVQQMKSWTDIRMGDDESAYYWAQKGLTQAKEFFGKNNNEVIAWLVLAIGIYKKNKREFEEAEKFIKESIVRFDSYYGGPYEVSDQADNNIILGDLYVEKGQFLEALRAYQLAEKIYDTLYTKKEADGYRQVYTKLAILFTQLGDDFLAKHYFDLHEKYFGKDDKGTKQILKSFKDHELHI